MRARLVTGAVLGVLVVACTSDPDAAIVTQSSLPPLTAAPGTSAALVEPTTSLAPASTTAGTEVAPATTAVPAPAPTNAPATDPPPTAPPSTTPSTTEAEVIGDGPVLTTPANGGDTAETPAAPTGLVPAFFAFDAAVTTPCTESEAGSVSLRWEVIGTETVDIAINDVTNITVAGQSPAGQIELPLDCAGTTYYVVAENADGRSHRSITLP